MFIVLKSFTNGTITAPKGKIINIKDKKVADMLLKTGVIASYSKKEQTNAEKDKEIVTLNAKVVEMQSIIDTLTAENTDLKAKLEEKTSDLASDLSDNDADNDTNSTENDANLDNKDGKEPSEEDNK